MMKIQQNKIPVAALASKANLDLTQTIGIAVVDNCAHLMTYDLPAKIADKMLQVTIPVWNIKTDNRPTFIKSVQLKGGLLIVETEGPITTPVKETIDAIAARLVSDGQITGFFPASDNRRNSQCYYGDSTSNLKNVTMGIENVRFMDNEDTLLFTQQGNNKVFMLKLSETDKAWTQKAIIVHRFEQNIKFLGRVQRNMVDVVLRDDRTFRATIEGQALSIKGSSLLKQGATAVFGMIKTASNDFLAALQGQELVLISAA